VEAIRAHAVAARGVQPLLVGAQENFTRINDALTQWQTDNPTDAVIEITDSGA